MSHQKKSKVRTEETREDWERERGGGMKSVPSFDELPAMGRQGCRRSLFKVLKDEQRGALITPDLTPAPVLRSCCASQELQPPPHARPTGRTSDWSRQKIKTGKYDELQASIKIQHFILLQQSSNGTYFISCSFKCSDCKQTIVDTQLCKKCGEGKGLELGVVKMMLINCWHADNGLALKRVRLWKWSNKLAWKEVTVSAVFSVKY